MRLPILGNMITRLAIPFNLYIAHQDRVVVETQLPKRSDLHIGEKLVQADQPIIAYRRRRAELIDQAAASDSQKEENQFSSLVS